MQSSSAAAMAVVLRLISCCTALLETAMTFKVPLLGLKSPLAPNFHPFQNADEKSKRHFACTYTRSLRGGKWVRRLPKFSKRLKHNGSIRCESSGDSTKSLIFRARSWCFCTLRRLASPESVHHISCKNLLFFFLYLKWKKKKKNQNRRDFLEFISPPGCCCYDIGVWHLNGQS